MLLLQSAEVSKGADRSEQQLKMVASAASAGEYKLTNKQLVNFNAVCNLAVVNYQLFLLILLYC